MRTLLLADIWGVFGAKKVDRAKSEALATALAAMNVADLRQGQMDHTGWHRTDA